MRVSATLIALLAGCGPTLARAPELPGPPEPAPQPRDAPLARFMRETINIPFAFAFIESGHPGLHHGAERSVRMYLATNMLADAARELITWTDPPAKTPDARAVFFEYARNLERHASLMERAVAERDPDRVTYHLGVIRHTCNSCHRYFRPAYLISQDVVGPGLEEHP